MADRSQAEIVKQVRLRKGSCKREECSRTQEYRTAGRMMFRAYRGSVQEGQAEERWYVK
jgi:hypothetical protein